MTCGRQAWRPGLWFVRVGTRAREIRDMIALQRLGWWALCVAGLGLASVDALAEGRAMRPRKYNPEDQTVEFFQAIDEGQLEVRFIPRDSSEARLRIRNATDKPLNIILPETFAGVPVMAQRGGGGMMGGGGGQAMGGGFGGGMGGMGGGMGGMGGGQFNVPAERLAEVKVPCVCLEHGKDEPRPRMPYEIRKLDTVTSKPQVEQLLRLFANGHVDQRAAQAAAWHLNNDMSWQELAAKQIERANGVSYSYFSAEEMQWALNAAEVAAQLVEKSQAEDSPESTSTGALHKIESGRQ